MVNKDLPCNICGDPVFCKMLCRKHYGRENREVLLKQAKEYYIRNRKSILAKMRERMKNLTIQQKEKLSIRRSLYYKKLRKENINHKILESLRARINLSLKRNLKNANTLKMTGCSIFELRQYLEKQFQPGMSWKNHSRHGWHIDHIKPCASFDLSKEEEQNKCFHYTNLQPLWAGDNLSKGSKILVEVHNE